jgi:hypothetical protein
MAEGQLPPVNLFDSRDYTYNSKIALLYGNNLAF